MCAYVCFYQKSYQTVGVYIRLGIAFGSVCVCKSLVQCVYVKERNHTVYRAVLCIVQVLVWVNTAFSSVCVYIESYQRRDRGVDRKRGGQA